MARNPRASDALVKMSITTDPEVVRRLKELGRIRDRSVSYVATAILKKYMPEYEAASEGR